MSEVGALREEIREIRDANRLSANAGDAADKCNSTIGDSISGIKSITAAEATGRSLSPSLSPVGGDKYRNSGCR